MSVFHFKAELVDRRAALATYRFQTDYVGEPSRIGLFSVDTSTWTWRIEESADSRAYADGTTRDQHCVSALIHKLRKEHRDDVLPPVVFHVA